MKIVFKNTEFLQKALKDLEKEIFKEAMRAEEFALAAEMQTKRACEAKDRVDDLIAQRQELLDNTNVVSTDDGSTKETLHKWGYISFL